METIEQAENILEISDNTNEEDLKYLDDYIKDTLSDDFELLKFLKK
ncbi:MAG: hypothetical protein LBC61_03755 [Candidatus Peribacteria bacterium]|nr:hypothetical protein [Candidatus Peribacteria bacterium]